MNLPERRSLRFVWWSGRFRSESSDGECLSRPFQTIPGSRFPGFQIVVPTQFLHSRWPFKRLLPFFVVAISQHLLLAALANPLLCCKFAPGSSRPLLVCHPARLIAFGRVLISRLVILVSLISCHQCRRTRWIISVSAIVFVEQFSCYSRRTPGATVAS